MYTYVLFVLLLIIICIIVNIQHSDRCKVIEFSGKNSAFGAVVIKVEK